MSNFGEALFDLLPVHSALQDKNNEGRKVIDNTVGEWFDHHDVVEFYDNLFFQTASGKYLDLFGRDFGVYRQVDESDDAYRERIVQEKLDHLTPDYLQKVYGLTLYDYIAPFDISENKLTSDNVYLANIFMAVADDDLKKILDKKFILNNSLIWLNADGTVDYINSTTNKYLLNKYSMIYDMENVDSFFDRNTSIKEVKLLLPNAVDVRNLFYDCTNLTDLILNAPKGRYINGLCANCDALVTIDINIPLGYPATNPNDIFPLESDVLKSVRIVMDSRMKSYWINMFSNSSNFPNLEYLSVNGEEVDLS